MENYTIGLAILVTLFLVFMRYLMYTMKNDTSDSTSIINQEEENKLINNAIKNLPK